MMDPMEPMICLCLAHQQATRLMEEVEVIREGILEDILAEMEIRQQVRLDLEDLEEREDHREVEVTLGDSPEDHLDHRAHLALEDRLEDTLLRDLETGVAMATPTISW